MSGSKDSVRELVWAIENGEEKTIQGYLADEIEMIGSDQTISKDQMIQSMLNLHSALDEMEYTILNLLHDDGLYVVQLQLSGVFADEYHHPNYETDEEMVVKPNGEEIGGTAAYVLRFDGDGRVEEMGSHGNERAMFEMDVIEYTGQPVEAAD